MIFFQLLLRSTFSFEFSSGAATSPNTTHLSEKYQIPCRTDVASVLQQHSSENLEYPPFRPFAISTRDISNLFTIDRI
jgi:hypothetical protein